MDIEQSWAILKNFLINAAKYVCGVSKTSNIKKQTCWWSDELKQQVKRRNQHEWFIWEKNKTEDAYKKYSEQRKKVKQLIKAEKEKALERLRKTARETKNCSIK